MDGSFFADLNLLAARNQMAISLGLNIIFGLWDRVSPHYPDCPLAGAPHRGCSLPRAGPPVVEDHGRALRCRSGSGTILSFEMGILGRD